MNLQTLRVPLIVLCAFTAVIVLFVKPYEQRQAEQQLKQSVAAR